MALFRFGAGWAVVGRVLCKPMGPAVSMSIWIFHWCVVAIGVGGGIRWCRECCRKFFRGVVAAFIGVNWYRFCNGYCECCRGGEGGVGRWLCEEQSLQIGDNWLWVHRWLWVGRVCVACVFVGVILDCLCSVIVTSSLCRCLSPIFFVYRAKVLVKCWQCFVVCSFCAPFSAGHFEHPIFFDDVQCYTNSAGLGDLVSPFFRKCSIFFDLCDEVLERGGRCPWCIALHKIDGHHVFVDGAVCVPEVSK